MTDTTVCTIYFIFEGALRLSFFIFSFSLDSFGSFTLYSDLQIDQHPNQTLWHMRERARQRTKFWIQPFSYTFSRKYKKTREKPRSLSHKVQTKYFVWKWKIHILQYHFYTKIQFTFFCLYISTCQIKDILNQTNNNIPHKKHNCLDSWANSSTKKAHQLSSRPLLSWEQ